MTIFQAQLACRWISVPALRASDFKLFAVFVTKLGTLRKLDLHSGHFMISPGEVLRGGERIVTA